MLILLIHPIWPTFTYSASNVNVLLKSASPLIKLNSSLLNLSFDEVSNIRGNIFQKGVIKKNWEEGTTKIRVLTGWVYTKLGGGGGKKNGKWPCRFMSGVEVGTCQKRSILPHLYSKTFYN